MGDPQRACWSALDLSSLGVDLGEGYILHIHLWWNRLRATPTRLPLQPQSGWQWLSYILISGSAFLATTTGWICRIHSQELKHLPSSSVMRCF